MSKKKSKMRKVKKYPFGGKVDDYLSEYLRLRNQRRQDIPTNIQSPEAAIYENQLAMDRATADVEGNPWYKALDAVGAYAMQQGTSMMGRGLSNLDLGGGTEKAAYGANIGMPMQGMAPIEAEGGEVAELPGGQLLDIEGPNHAQGGVPAVLPGGTRIDSKRIKIDGVPLADRTKKRKKKEVTLEELMEIDPTDVLVKNALERTGQVNEAESAHDEELQNFIGGLMEERFPEEGMEKAQYGTVVEPEPKDEEELSFMQRLLAGTKNVAGKGVKALGEYMTSPGAPTLGDALGIYGNYKQGQVGVNSVLANRAGDTPNVNHFLNYGKEGLRTMDEASQYARQIRDSNLRDIDAAQRGVTGRMRKSARGVNTLRSFDLAAGSSFEDARRGAYNDYSKAMADFLTARAGMQDARDAQVMGAEANRDLADRQDRDAFFTNLGQARIDQARAMTQVGQNLNQLKERGVTSEALNGMFDILSVDPKTGTVKVKEGASLTGDQQRIMDNFDYKEAGYQEKEWKEMSRDQRIIAVIMSSI